MIPFWLQGHGVMPRAKPLENRSVQRPEDPFERYGSIQSPLCIVRPEDSDGSAGSG